MALATVYSFTYSRDTRSPAQVYIKQDGFAGTADTIDVASMVIRPASVNDEFTTGVLEHTLELVIYDKDYTNNGEVSDYLFGTDVDDYRIIVDTDDFGEVFVGIPYIDSIRKGYYDGEPVIKIKTSTVTTWLQKQEWTYSYKWKEFHTFFVDTLQSFYSKDLYISMEWEEDNASGSWRPDLLRINQDDLLRDLESPTYKDVIDRMCESFDLQIFFMIDRWYIREINEYDASSIAVYTYSTAGAKSSDVLNKNASKTAADFWFEPIQGRIEKLSQATVFTKVQFGAYQWEDRDFSEFTGGFPDYGFLSAGTISDGSPGLIIPTPDDGTTFRKEGTEIVRKRVGGTDTYLTLRLEIEFDRDTAASETGGDGNYEVDYIRIKAISTTGGTDLWLDPDGSWETSAVEFTYSYGILSGDYSDTGNGNASTVNEVVALESNTFPNFDKYRIQAECIFSTTASNVDQLKYVDVYVEPRETVDIDNSDIATGTFAQGGVVVSRDSYIADRDENYVGSLQYYNGTSWQPASAFNTNTFTTELAKKIATRQHTDLYTIDCESYESEELFLDVRLVDSTNSRNFIIQSADWNIFGSDRVRNLAIQQNISATGLTLTKSSIG